MRIPGTGILIRASLLIIGTFFVMLFVAPSAANDTPKSTALDDKIALALSSNVDRLDILYIPEDEESPIGYSPISLEGLYSVKIIIRDFRETEFSSKLLSQLKASSIREKGDAHGDMRWGLIFFDANKKRLVSMYFDRFGENGLVDDIPVVLNAKLIRFLSRKVAIK